MRSSPQKRGRQRGPSRKPTCPPPACSSRSRLPLLVASSRGNAVAGKEGVVLRMEKKRGNPDTVEEPFAATGGVVLFRVLEAVDRRGEKVVERAQRSGPVHAGHVQPRGQSGFLGPDLPLEGPEEVAGVGTTHGRPLQQVAPGGQVVRHRHGHRRVQEAPATVLALAHELQEDVAAQGEPHGTNAPAGLGLPKALQDVGRVRGGAGMIEAVQAVRLAAATAEVQGHRPDAPELQLPAHVADVTPRGRALQAVHDQRDGRVGARVGPPIQVEEVPVGGLPPLAAEGRLARRPEEPGDQGLEMRAGRPRRRLERPGAEGVRARGRDGTGQGAHGR